MDDNGIVKVDGKVVESVENGIDSIDAQQTKTMATYDVKSDTDGCTWNNSRIIVEIECHSLDGS